MHELTIRGIATVPGLVLSCAFASVACAGDAALVVRNGVVWTVDAARPTADALAVADGRFVYVGTDAGVEAFIGERTQVIDLDGAFVTPGFYDNHVHFEATGRLLYGLNLLDVADEANFVARIRDVHERYAPGTWITGGDWSAYESWNEGSIGAATGPGDGHVYGEYFLPQRSMIDAFTGERPVLVHRFDRKVYLANAAALARAGITAGAPDPAGIEVQRDAEGVPTGALFNPVSPAVQSTLLVKDNVAALFAALIPAPSRAQRIAETRAAWQQMARVGVTSYSDVTSDPVYVDIYRELRDAGEMTARVRFRAPLEQWRSLANLGIAARFGDDWIRFGAVKAWVDGIMGNSTARFYSPYTHDPDSRGIWRDVMFPFQRDPDDPEAMQSNLERLALDADARGIQLAVHAIGDEANGYVLDMLERLIEKNGARDRRFRLVHAQVMTDRDIERAGELGIVAEVQPFHVADDMRWMEERIGHERSRGAYAFRRLWDAGAVVSFGSDSPGTNASRYYLNPMLGIYAAVTRKTLSGQPEGGWFAAERLTVEEALAAYTIHSAYAGFEETIKGSITVGKLADFVVLSDNLLTMDPDAIKDVEVERTVVGGRIVFSIN